ncbi:MAG TPA: hypothetical protein VG602_03350, partial [Actinomycetota bacterium]|nr:hypothetical protein [Actinomycetota bacterium]
HKGESHGGAYLLDLQTDEVTRLLDWNDAAIDWEGRGGDRGLRGIAFHGGRVFLAASDEIFIYDRNFQLQGSLRNPYLKHCHEIFVAGDRLFATSTGFDSVLECDLLSLSFVRGYCVRFRGLWRFRQLRWGLHLRPRPRFWTYDPNGHGGPTPWDSSHINNVFVRDGTVFVSGTGLGHLWAIGSGGLSKYARIPYLTHNARPFRDGVLLNQTGNDQVAFLTRTGQTIKSFPVKHYDESQLENAHLPRDFARQGFTRGLAVLSDTVFAAGSSPATVTVYDFETAQPVKSVTVTMDVRNSVHGLEVWPFD